MALIKCKECGHSVSDRAEVCPNCGNPMTCVSKQESVLDNFQPQSNRCRMVMIAKVIIATFAVAVIVGHFWTEYVEHEKRQKAKKEKLTYSEELVRQAEKGSIDAQCNLGVCYANGYGIAQDYDEAVKWFEKVAEQGDARGMRNLGLFYRKGHGVSQDYGEAVKWFEKAIEHGDAKAMVHLGECYVDSQDYGEAVKWFKKAVEQGIPLAASYLGYCYEHGYGVIQDKREAKKWYEKAVNM